MENNETKWKTLKLNDETKWKTMKLHEKQWNSMTNYETPRNLMKTMKLDENNETRWKTVKHDETH